LTIKLVRVFSQQTLILKAHSTIPDRKVTKKNDPFTWILEKNFVIFLGVFLFVKIEEYKSSVKIGGIFIDFRVSKTRKDLSLTWKFHILIKRIKARFQIVKFFINDIYARMPS